MKLVFFSSNNISMQKRKYGLFQRDKQPNINQEQEQQQQLQQPLQNSLQTQSIKSISNINETPNRNELVDVQSDIQFYIYNCLTDDDWEKIATSLLKVQHQYQYNKQETNLQGHHILLGLIKAIGDIYDIDLELMYQLCLENIHSKFQQTKEDNLPDFIAPLIYIMTKQLRQSDQQHSTHQKDSDNEKDLRSQENATILLASQQETQQLQDFLMQWETLETQAEPFIGDGVQVQDIIKAREDQLNLILSQILDKYSENYQYFHKDNNLNRSFFIQPTDQQQILQHNLWNDILKILTNTQNKNEQNSAKIVEDVKDHAIEMISQAQLQNSTNVKNFIKRLFAIIFCKKSNLATIERTLRLLFWILANPNEFIELLNSMTENQRINNAPWISDKRPNVIAQDWDEIIQWYKFFPKLSHLVIRISEQQTDNFCKRMADFDQYLKYFVESSETRVQIFEAPGLKFAFQYYQQSFNLKNFNGVDDKTMADEVRSWYPKGDIRDGVCLIVVGPAKCVYSERPYKYLHVTAPVQEKHQRLQLNCSHELISATFVNVFVDAPRGFGKLKALYCSNCLFNCDIYIFSSLKYLFYQQGPINPTVACDKEENKNHQKVEIENFNQEQQPNQLSSVLQQMLKLSQPEYVYIKNDIEEFNQPEISIDTSQLKTFCYEYKDKNTLKLKIYGSINPFGFFVQQESHCDHPIKIETFQCGEGNITTTQQQEHD